MILWLVLAGLTALVVISMLAPLLRGARPVADPSAHDMAVYTAQLKDIEQDEQHGKIDARGAVEARNEIERRMLALDHRVGTRRILSRPLRLTVTVLLALAVPAAAGGLYLRLGTPGLPDQPLASRTSPDADLMAALAVLEQRVAQAPEDAETQIVYGRALFAADRYPEASAAFRRAVALTDSRPDTVALYGEALVYESGGVVTAEAGGVFAQVPDQPRSRFYAAVAAYQAGDRAKALDAWVGLAADAPADAAWLPAVEARIEAVARELGQDPATLLAERAEAAPAVDNAQIRGMVEGLQARLQNETPGDLEGWLMLARSLQVLGEMEQAAAAWQRAAALAPDDADVLVGYGVALMRTSAPDGAVPTDVAALMARVLRLDADNVDALWFAGVGALQSDDEVTALAHWRRLLELLPTDSTEHAVVLRRLEGIGASP